VRDAGKRFAQQNRGGEDATVTVILDGENAWEHYPGGGRPFLRTLYRKLQTAFDIETVTMSAAVAGSGRPLETVFPGSWINGDFYIWAGHRDDHRAWGQLAAARQAFETAKETVRPDARARAWEELMIAEGSDWFWWYGDDHSSDHDREFDDLFRRHVRNVYRALEQPAPDDLHVTNITTEAPGGPIPLGALTTPDIEGQSTDFTEWACAVEVPLGGGGGTMHRVAGQLVRGLRVAADLQCLYLRVEGQELARRMLAAEVGLALLQDRPRPLRVDLGRNGGPRWRANNVVTVAVAFDSLGARAGDRLSLSLLVTDSAGHVIEQHPATQPFEVDVPTRDHDAINWVV
jgi:hypothetical protein